MKFIPSFIKSCELPQDFIGGKLTDAYEEVKLLQSNIYI